MKKVIIILFMFSFFTKIAAANNGNAYDYEFTGIDGDVIQLSKYRGKSNCSCKCCKQMWIYASI
jgi:hypothetical protein